MTCRPNLLRFMPHVQAMQHVGATFSNYFVTDSLCCPSRTATLTGQYAHNNGVFTNTGTDGGYATFQAHNDVTHTFGVALQKVGYRTGFMGKYLNGYLPTDPVPQGWNTWDVAGNGYPEFNYDLNENGAVKHYAHQPVDYLTDVLSGKAQGFIDQATTDHRPFMLEVATFAPHAPSTPAPRDADLFPTLKAPRTAAYDRLPTDPPSWLKGRAPLTLAQQQMINQKFRLRARSVVAVDEMIGRLTEELKAKGLAGNTDIVFSSDNGFHMGEYRLLPGKQTAFDTDIHVPLIISGPDTRPNSTITELASNIDLNPTFLQLGKALVDPHQTDGLSLVPLLAGQHPASWPTAVLVEHHGPNDSPSDPDRQTKAAADPPSYEAIRTATFTYVTYRGSKDREYYDLRHDPAELHNLAGHVSHVTLARLQLEVTALSHCKGQVSCRAAALVH